MGYNQNSPEGALVPELKSLEFLQQISEKSIDAIYTPERKGDVKHSKASIEKIETNLCYIPEIKFKKGLEITYNWYNQSFATSK